MGGGGGREREAYILAVHLLGEVVQVPTSQLQVALIQPTYIIIVALATDIGNDYNNKR